MFILLPLFLTGPYPITIALFETFAIFTMIKYIEQLWNISTETNLCFHSITSTSMLAEMTCTMNNSNEKLEDNFL